jgi:hypothetical protein
MTNYFQPTCIDLTSSDNLDLSHVSVTSFAVKPVSIQRVRSFIEKWHYSNNVNGLNISLVFGLFYKNQLIGAIVYGSLAMANTWKKYGKKESEVVELKRLCCIDKTKKNTESFFIAKTIKFIKKYTKYKTIISYADPFHNHQGTIYKASNFEFKGLTSKGKVIKFKDKIYHDKAIRSVDDKKKVKPFALELIKAINEKQAIYINTPEKHIFCYEIKRKSKTITSLMFQKTNHNQLSVFESYATSS